MATAAMAWSNLSLTHFCVLACVPAAGKSASMNCGGFLGGWHCMSAAGMMPASTLDDGMADGMIYSHEPFSNLCADMKWVAELGAWSTQKKNKTDETKSLSI